MSKYAEMSYFEINKLVADRLGLWVYKDQNPIGFKVDVACVEGLDLIDIPSVDYCNNPSDAWPIILEYKIGIDTIGFKGGEDRVWWAELTFDEYGDYHYAEDKNPLRAAMIVYLMMEDK